MKVYIATEEEKQAAFSLRFEVFVDEQQVPREIELDGDDARALHLLADEDGQPVGCARLLFEQDGTAHIGRLAVRRSCRGKGIGAAICRFAIAYGRDRGYRCFWLHAQCAAAGFYEKLGFLPEGDVFDEAGMPHIKMVIYDKGEREE